MTGRPLQSQSLWQSFGFAWSGMYHALLTERNFQIHTSIALLVVVAGLRLHISRNDWLALLLIIAMMGATELINTAIEYLGDAATNGVVNEDVRLAKNIAAAACLLISVIAVVMGLIIFAPYMPVHWHTP